MRVIGVLLLSGVASGAAAQTIYSLEPASPVSAGQEVAMRIDSSLGCFHSNFIDVTRDGATVTVVADMTDALPPGGCPAAWQTPRFVSLGTFAAGHYEVEVTACSNPTPPTPECGLEATLPLTVLGNSGTAFTVPTLSEAVVAGLTLAVMVLGAFGTRRR